MQPELRSTAGLTPEEIVRGDWPLRKLRPHFESWESILQFHAQEMSRDFPAGPVGGICHACGRAPATLGVVYSWRAYYDTAETVLKSFLLSLLGIFLRRLRWEYRILDFSTHHVLCAPCYRRFRRRRLASEIISKLSLGVFIVALSYLALFGTIFFTVLSRGPMAKDVVLFGKVAGGALIITVISVIGLQATRRWGTPPSFVRIGKLPFQCVGLEELS